MSHYKPSPGRIPPTVQEEIASTITALEDKKEEADTCTIEVISPSATSKPLPMPRSGQGSAAAKGRMQAPPIIAEDIISHLAGLCHYKPYGICKRRQSNGTVFCSFTNADGTRCPNFVARPEDTRVCKNGWHVENDGHCHIEDLVAHRQALNIRQAEERAIAQAENMAQFDRDFPSPSNSAATMRSSCEIIQTPNQSRSQSQDQLRQDRLRDERERDKWSPAFWNVSLPIPPGLLGLAGMGK